jgi:glucosamine--fructose-6-phosphate aminotransferase (isomerizing)
MTATRDSHQSTLLKEINEQPGVFQRLMDDGLAEALSFASRLEEQEFQYILIAARGTSDNAARYAKYLWGAHNRYPVALAAPSLFSTYHRPPNLEGALVVGFSQSGQSPDLVAVMEEAKRQGTPSLAIVNEVDSPLARAADHVLDVRAGTEQAVAATKSYTGQLLAATMIGAGWRGAPPGMIDALGDLPGFAATALEGAAAAEKAAAHFAAAEACAVLGRGFNHATAFEWSLKLQEVTYTLAQPHSSADFRHGPIAVVESGFPVFVVAPEGVVADELLELASDLHRERDADLLVISDRSGLEVTDHVLPLPGGVPEWLSPIPAIIAGQLFTYYLSLAKRQDPDNPRGLSKVTRTV